MTHRITFFLSFLIPCFLVAGIANALTSDTGGGQPCPTRADLRAKEAACAADNLGSETIRDERQCPTIRCTKPQSFCPDAADLERQRLFCTKQGAEAVTYFDGICTVVNCGGVEKVGQKMTCEKIVTRDGCVQIKCLDGYEFDSCKKQACEAPLQIDEKEESVYCRASIDRDGCTVKTCGNSVQRSCPPPPEVTKGEVTCTVVRVEKGSNCVIRKCDDGTYDRGCPVKEKSGVFRSEKPSRRLMYQDRKTNPRQTGTRPKASSSSSYSSSSSL